MKNFCSRGILLEKGKVALEASGNDIISEYMRRTVGDGGSGVGEQDEPRPS